MARIYNSFNFIGNIAIPKDKKKFHDEKDNGQGWISHKINFAIKESKLNSAFLELYGGKKADESGNVFTFSKGLHGEKGNKLEIPFKDRLKESTLNMVADFKKIVIDLETDFEIKEKYTKLFFQILALERRENITEEDKKKLADYKAEFKDLSQNRHEFISEYDAVLFLIKNLEKYKNYKFKVTGNIDCYFNNNTYLKYIPQNIEIVPEETQNQLKAIMDIFFNKESLDDKDVMEDKKIYIDGYIQNYDRSIKEDRFYNLQFLINATNINFDDSEHVELLDLIKSPFTEIDDDNYYHLLHEINVYRGAEKTEFTYENLTDKQKQYVDKGLATVESYAPRNKEILGNNVNELRIVKGILEERNGIDFTDGKINTELNEDDFFELIVKDTSDISYKDVKKEDKKEVIKEAKEVSNVEKQDLDAKLNSLFG